MKVIRDEDKNSNKYIKSFDVNITTGDCSELKVNMADGSRPKYLNIPSNVKRLLELMSEQHEKNKEQEQEIIRKMKLNKLKSLLAFLGSVISTTVIISTFPNLEAIMLIDLIKLVVPTGLFVYSSAEYVKVKKSLNKLNDLSKYVFLEENEEILNNADLEDSNILENVKRKDRKEIERIITRNNSEQSNIFDWNSIDNLSLETLRQIKDNIVRDNYLGLGETEKVQTKPTAKTYVIK